MQAQQNEEELPVTATFRGQLSLPRVSPATFDLANHSCTFSVLSNKTSASKRQSLRDDLNNIEYHGGTAPIEPDRASKKPLPKEFPEKLNDLWLFCEIARRTANEYVDNMVQENRSARVTPSQCTTREIILGTKRTGLTECTQTIVPKKR